MYNTVEKFPTGVHENEKHQNLNLSEGLKVLLLHCLLFPSGYEFTKDKMVQLWIAQGFIRDTSLRTLEDMGRVHFNSLVAMDFILPWRYRGSPDYDPSFDPYDDESNSWWYILNGTKIKNLEENEFSSSGYYMRVENRHELRRLNDRTQTLHLSLNCMDMSEFTLTSLENFKQLQTFLLLVGCGHSIGEELFWSLRLLRTVDLSHTCITELPSSIGYVQPLRYLDVSNTLIRMLPYSIRKLQNLQTLKFKMCSRLSYVLPGIEELTNLRHLEHDLFPVYVTPPAKIGNLTNLQTLSAFAVDSNEGFLLKELKNLNSLGGKLRISRLERVTSREEAKDAALDQKKYLYELELQWNVMQVEKALLQNEILEFLQPHFYLKVLTVRYYSGSRLPSWFSNPKFEHLISITLYSCKNCQLLPCLGVLPALKFLRIREMNEVKEIDHQFHRTESAQGQHAFPKLVTFAIYEMLNLKEWTGVEIGDLPSLRKLTVGSCSKLVTLPSLLYLNSLKRLEIKYCPLLHSLPEEGLSASLESLAIYNCPKLKESCTREKGQDWGKIAHVTSIWIDGEEMQDTVES